MMDYTIYDFEAPSRRIDALAWACNCKTPRTKNREQIFTKMYPTEVDAEGLCVLCGHYALRMDAKTLGMAWQRGKFFRQQNYKKVSK